MVFHLAEKSAVPGTRPTKSPFHRHVGSATNIATVPPPLLVIWYDPYETPPASPTPEDTVPGPRPPVSYFSDNMPSRCAIRAPPFPELLSVSAQRSQPSEARWPGKTRSSMGPASATTLAVVSARGHVGEESCDLSI